MAKRIGGVRRKTRGKLKKSIRRKGKISVTNYLQDLQINDIVQLISEPAIHKGMYHPRFYGKSGIVTRKLGNCYQIKISDQGKQKLLTVHPVHLKKCQIQK